jgi:tripartite-type tricarboxylate transporter receptor subunit TctC
MFDPAAGRSCFSLAFALLAAAPCAFAQAYPSKPIRLVVPYAAGGAVDAMARVFGPKYSEAWGQPVVIENRAGAGGNLGSEVVAKAAPDGHVWLLNTSGQAVAPALYRKLNYDAIKDLAPVSTFIAAALILVTPPQVQAGTLRELIALAKAQPGKLNFGSTGIGSGPHLAQELFKSMAGIDVVHVPYKGDAMLFPALFVNEVQFGVVPSQTAMAHVRSGKVKALAVTNARRSSALPDVPTVAESGPLAGYEFGGWTGLFVTAGTPREVIRRINDETARVVKLPEVVKYYSAWGVEPDYRNTEDFTARYHADIEKYTRIVRDARVPLVD